MLKSFTFCLLRLIPFFSKLREMPLFQQLNIFILFVFKTFLRSFGNLGIGISASASALTLASASALQNFLFVLRSFYFCLSNYIIKKTSTVKSFSSTLAHIPGSFSRCLEQLFFGKPVCTCF